MPFTNNQQSEDTCGNNTLLHLTLAEATTQDHLTLVRASVAASLPWLLVLFNKVQAIVQHPPCTMKQGTAQQVAQLVASKPILVIPCETVGYIY